jgi:hypothetical protein
LVVVVVDDDLAVVVDDDVELEVVVAVYFALGCSMEEAWICRVDGST